MDNFEKAKDNFLSKEKNLSNYATRSSDAIRFKEENEDIRPPFFHDIDRIIHSLSYTRYLNKTQVYTLNSNDHVSRRITHVQLVSKIARTIGRALNLNEDLIEAIALGHDIGHTPLGHAGEAILNRLSLKELGEYFAHNIQGVRYYMYISKDGKGLNLTLQTLDGIMTHNGEMLSPIYEPISKDKEEFLREYNESYKELKKSKKYHPIPKEIRDVLGDNNRDIVNTIVLDIINESIDKPYIKMSDKVYNALFALKKFNNDNIYSKSMTKEELDYYEKGINKLYHIYLEDIKSNNKDSIIYKIFLNHQDELYLKNTNIKRQVIDFIAGMTDDFLVREIKKYDVNSVVKN